MATGQPSGMTDMARYDLAFGVLLAVLAAIVGLELSPWVRTPRSAGPLPAPAALASPAMVGVEPVAAYIGQVLARPLFTEGRRPPAAASTPATQARVDKLPRLSGILVMGHDRRAIFESGGKPVVGVVGTQIGAYRIVAIDADRVTVQGPGGAEAMGLAYGANGSATPAAVAPGILEQLNSGAQLPPGMPKTPTLLEMMANLPKTMPPVAGGLPLNDTRPPR